MNALLIQLWVTGCVLFSHLRYSHLRSGVILFTFRATLLRSEGVLKYSDDRKRHMFARRKLLTFGMRNGTCLLMFFWWEVAHSYIKLKE